MISKEIIQTIIETARVEEVVSDFVNLKRRGSNYVGLCPFHNEKTPSFSVSASKGIYKCFGCGKAGNSVNFIMEHEHYTYPEALRYLANKYNIEIEEQEPTPEYLQEQSNRESLYNISEFAGKYFTDCLFNTQEGRAVALTYLREREFSDESIQQFQLGYCPESWNEFTNHALKNSYNIQFLIKSGLTVERGGGDHYDRFRGRVIFPIHSLTGRILGFGGRIMRRDENKPKYINSPESEIYNKSRVLYGLFFAKNAILSADNCFLVEGYTDVISLCQNGVKNVVASSGTSLTADQIRLIKRYTSNITILYDGDEAGLKASFRGIDLVLEQGMNVKVVLFPEGEDPDSFARKKRPAEIRDFLAENAKDFIKLKTGLLLEEVKDDPVKKAGLIKNVVGSISLIPDNITRSMYLKESAALMDIEEQTLVFELNKLLRSRYQAKIRQGQTEEPDFIEPVTEKTAQPYPQLNDHFFQESEIMRLLLLYGDELITFENLNEFERIEVFPVKISDFIMNDLRNDDIIFDHPVLQQIYNEMTDLQNRGEKSTSLQYFISHSNPEVMQMTIEIVSSKHELSENWKKNKIFVNSEDQQLKQIVTSSVLALKAKKINRILNDVRVKLKNAVSIDEQIELLQLNMQYKEIESQINQKLGRVITP